VIEGDCYGFVGSKAIGLSSHHSSRVLEACGFASGDLDLGAEPVLQRFLMGAVPVVTLQDVDLATRRLCTKRWPRRIWRWRS
jgi:hypothetical protein